LDEDTTQITFLFKFAVILQKLQFCLNFQ